MDNRLTLDVFVGAENGFFVTSTIVAGERDAVVIDAQFTRSDARRLAERIKALGKNLTTVYITHGHPDHYMGLNVLQEEFPGARLVTAPEVIPAIDEGKAAKVAQWKPLYADELPDNPVTPTALEGDVINLEGNELRVIHLGQGDDHSSTAVSIPALSAVVAGDFVYNGTHVWLAETNTETRKQWIENIGKLAAMNPTTVVPGHKAPGADDDGGRALKETRSYIEAFDAAARSAPNAEMLTKGMNEQFGDRALPIILEIAAGAAFSGEPLSTESR